jgi:multisite-specific tRNA:(cytosine-C5)-methyltransferase
MCAAPGSKTFQLLDVNTNQQIKPGSLPDEMVIANDLMSRDVIFLSTKQKKCTANLIVTNNEAQHLPGCPSDKNSPKSF